MKNQEEEIKNIVKKLKKYNFVKAIIQFGSSIAKNEKPLSDIDIAVITNSEDKKIDSEIFSHASEKIDIAIFNRLPLYIQFEVFKHGKILFANDKKFLLKIKQIVLKQYLEMSYFYERMSKRILA